jgi:hypothetical protein
MSKTKEGKATSSPARHHQTHTNGRVLRNAIIRRLRSTSRVEDHNRASERGIAILGHVVANQLSCRQGILRGHWWLGSDRVAPIHVTEKVMHCSRDEA